MVNLKSNQIWIPYVIAVVSMFLVTMSGTTFSSIAASEDPWKCTELKGCNVPDCLKKCVAKYGYINCDGARCEGKGKHRQCCCEVNIRPPPPPVSSNLSESDG
ncbi:hypothetical protein ACP70R_007854 [Stipagrostis hirtigluma subsp. patula]